MKSISETELEIMNYVWEEDRDVTVKEVQAHFEQANDWKVTTIQTFLKRLSDKEYLAIIKKNRTNYYRPKISKNDYTVMETDKIINRVHSGSLYNFITSFSGSDSMSDEEITELKAWLSKK